MFKCLFGPQKLLLPFTYHAITSQPTKLKLIRTHKSSFRSFRHNYRRNGKRSTMRQLCLSVRFSYLFHNFPRRHLQRKKVQGEPDSHPSLQSWPHHCLHLQFSHWRIGTTNSFNNPWHRLPPSSQSRANHRRELTTMTTMTMAVKQKSRH